jgi:hypothetical protein
VNKLVGGTYVVSQQHQMSSFDEYRDQVYPAALQRIAEILNATPLRALEELVLRVMHLIECRHLTIPDTSEGQIFQLLAVKACNEALGFVACCRAGSTWSAYHHTRALFEVYASTEHIVAKPASRQKRVARFLEYRDFVRYQKHLGQLAKNLPPEDFEAQRMVSIADVQSLETRRDHWCKLYGQQDLLKVQHWHSPASIRSMFEDCDRKPPSDDPVATSTRDWWFSYELVCHMTHVSPVGHFGVGAGGLPVLGFSDLTTTSRLIVLSAEALVQAVLTWDQEYIPGCRLRRRTQNQVQQYRLRVVQSVG